MVESVGQRVARLRRARGLAQSELGVSAALVSRIESGSRPATSKALLAIAAKLGVSTSYLETGEDTLVDELVALSRAIVEGRGTVSAVELAEKTLAALEGVSV